ncbi:MAG: hypothetical protein Q9190_002710 [Brigantiaea leucoxantha]
MAPSKVVVSSDETATATAHDNYSPPKPPNKSYPMPKSIIFPDDGIKTSGQHPPLYEQLAPYSSFPSHISGPTVWSPHEYTSHPERWIHPFTPSEISSLSLAADTFISLSIPLTAISKTTFRLPPPLSSLLTSIRSSLLNGAGFILFRGLPVHAWGLHKSAIAYMGLGTHLGHPVSQNGKGHVLGHVKDLGEDSSRIDRVRIYRTNARQFFHADDADLVGLLWDPYFVRSLTRFSDAGLIPPLSPEQLEAASVLEETCQRHALHMILEVGDIQFLSNCHVLHARTAYKDHAPPMPRRHLMRLWLATPESEGGWRLPFHDSKEKKRGGIQVNDVAPLAELDAA